MYLKPIQEFPGLLDPGYLSLCFWMSSSAGVDRNRLWERQRGVDGRGWCHGIQTWEFLSSVVTSSSKMWPQNLEIPKSEFHIIILCHQHPFTYPMTCSLPRCCPSENTMMNNQETWEFPNGLRYTQGRHTDKKKEPWVDFFGWAKGHGTIYLCNRAPLQIR